MIAFFDSAEILGLIIGAVMILWGLAVVIINVWSIFKK